MLAATLQARLQRSRERLLALVRQVDEGVISGQHSPIMGPILWDLGHIAAFEEVWLHKAVDGWRPEGGEGLPALFDAQVHARSTRGRLTLPCLADALDRLERVRERSLERLQRGGFDGALTTDGFVYNLVAQHEAWHVETILAALNLREDVVLPVRSAGSGAGEHGGRRRFEGGWVDIGTADRSRSYDNERPAHRIELAPFELATHAVTVGEFRAFVDAGGYRERSLWSEAGWDYRASIEGPHGWHDDGIQRFGHRVPYVDSEPVQHVSFYEAEAFASWVGARLPTEFEWEHAARSDHGRHVESDDRGPQCVHACDGMGMLGNTWEWTSTIFDRYPGFQWFPYRDYSTPFFDDAMPVLRGGSWATGEVLARPTLRSWDLPNRRATIFVGFRLAWDG